MILSGYTPYSEDRLHELGCMACKVLKLYMLYGVIMHVSVLSLRLVSCHPPQTALMQYRKAERRTLKYRVRSIRSISTKYRVFLTQNMLTNAASFNFQWPFLNTTRNDLLTFDWFN